MNRSLLLFLGVTFFFPGIPAYAGDPLQLTDARLGDCNACHKDEVMLPEGHLATVDMHLDKCLMCHRKDTVDVQSQMPLSHTHQLSAVTCKDCHGETETPEPMEMDKCVSCHNIEEISARTQTEHDNPHNSPHYGLDLDCTYCHYQHDKSENFCAQCHDDIFVVPSPMLPRTGVKSVDPEKNRQCSTCHGGADLAAFSTSAHGDNGCQSCHKDVSDITRHMNKQEVPLLSSCGTCHEEQENEHLQSYHHLKEELACQDCHTDIHAVTVTGEHTKQQNITGCNRCHDEKNDFVSRGHAASILEGNKDAASCADCHGVHNTPVFGESPEEITRKREYFTASCIGCHGDEEIAARNDLDAETVLNYEETYHGKVFFLGYPERIAGCADCHTGHNILPEDDPASPIHHDNLVENCGNCHEGFHPRFVSFVAHPDENDRQHFRALFWTRIFMVGLLGGVFIFFWTHSFLWWRKVYWDKSRQRATGMPPKPILPEDLASQYVRRFTIRDRVMHIFLIASFFGIVISGFPLKYYDSPWAQTLMSVLGGAENAGFIHRLSAATMWILFLYTFILSLKFLFPKAKGKGWVARLFGPDSLFPRKKDFVDMGGMFRWFFGKQEHWPEFDRWTYWEKFDFLAVFWGMFVIGLSGLMLWFPEESSWIFPGWMINVATLAHSEEAFLAAVFIFTVHFFNNHFVPNKFPLETNVFTGRYTLEALKHERPVEYERIMAENRLEEIKVDGPGVFAQLFAGIIGLLSVALGIFLTILIFWAVFTS